MLEHSKLLEHLHYDPETGVWTWLIQSSSRALRGQRAGTLDKDGYRLIGFNKKIYRSARLAYFYMREEWPAIEIDHKNTVPDDDRWDNLREATRSLNQYNRKKASTNLSGFKGVTWHKHHRLWRATIQLQGKNKTIGYYQTAEDAAKAYIETAQKHFGEFARA